VRRSLVLVSAVVVVAIIIGLVVGLAVRGPEVHDVSPADRAKAEAAVTTQSPGTVRKIACTASGHVSACSIFVERGHSGRCQDWAVTLAPNSPARLVRLGTYSC
jgi:hypothetical protein